MRHRRRLTRTLIAIALALTGLATAAIVANRGPADQVNPWAQPMPSGSAAIRAAPGVSTSSSPRQSPSHSQSPNTPKSANSRSSDPPQWPATRNPKKGVSLWPSFYGAAAALLDVRASWFYDWSVDGTANIAPAGVEFVPMIWGGGAVNPQALSRARTHGRVLLGFNEPDLGSQSNMTVEQALDQWSQLMDTGMRLGSPAPAYGADQPGGWLDRFMSGLKARGYRVDFIALHWYGSDFSPAAVDQLRQYLQATYDRYHLPIWLTEYALINFRDRRSGQHRSSRLHSFGRRPRCCKVYPMSSDMPGSPCPVPTLVTRVCT